MWNDCVNTIGCALNLIGTVISLLSILRMSVKNIMWTKTAAAFDAKPLPLLEQRKQARIGIMLVVLGCASQIYGIWNKDITRNQFIVFLVVEAIAISISIVLILRKHKKDKNEMLR